MRRGALSLLALGSLIAVASLPASAGALCFRVAGAKGATCVHESKNPKEMVLNISVEGEYLFTHEETGVNQNACNTTLGTTPYHAHSELAVRLKVDWRHVKVPFGPVHGGTRIPVVYESERTSTVHGNYAFSGYDYDENCHMVSWPAGGGAACSGAFGAVNGEGSTLMVNSVGDLGSPSPGSSRVNVLLTPAQELAPGLTILPPGCQDDGSPSLLHTFSMAYGEGFEVPDTHLSLNVSESGHSVGGYSFAKGNVPAQVAYPIGFTTNCSVPASQLTCMQSWSPPGSSQSQISPTTVHVERVGVIK